MDLLGQGYSPLSVTGQTALRVCSAAVDHRPTQRNDQKIPLTHAAAAAVVSVSGTAAAGTGTDDCVICCWCWYR